VEDEGQERPTRADEPQESIKRSRESAPNRSAPISSAASSRMMMMSSMPATFGLLGIVD
jgi:hypothetical protein